MTAHTASATSNTSDCRQATTASGTPDDRSARNTHYDDEEFSLDL